jgi:hypothetical protein
MRVGLPRLVWSWLWPAQIIDIALSAVFALVLLQALNFPPEARLFPMLVSIAGLMLVSLRLIKRADGDANAADGTIVSDEPVEAHPPGRLALATLSAPVYSLMVWGIGFHAASLMMLIGFPYCLGYRRLPILVPMAFVFVAILTGIFSYAMDMNLPAGVLNRWISNALLGPR